MLSRVNYNLRCFLRSPALGEVRSDLQCLAERTGVVDLNCRQFMHIQGAALVTCADNFDIARQMSANLDIEYLQTTVKEALHKLQKIHSDVTCLRGEANTVTEYIRGRIQKLKNEATTIEETITGKKQEQANLRSAISGMESDISNKEADARRLEHKARINEVGGDVWTGLGIGCAVAGVVAAPFTLGLSLGLAGAGIAGVAIGGREKHVATKLRSAASRQRQSVRYLQSRIASYEQDIVGLSGERQHKGQQLEQIQGFSRTVHSALKDINEFGTLLNTFIRNLSNFEASIANVSKTGQSVGVIQGALKTTSWGKGVSIPPTARATYNHCVNQLLEIRGYLRQMDMISQEADESLDRLSMCKIHAICFVCIWIVYLIF